ncbi:MAG: hypothetical protein LEGION0398_MBIBDBAK_00303 [Legionellaceae bacterium]
MFINRALIIANIFLLSACVGQHTFVKPAEDNSAIQLTEAAVSVNHALNELTAIEKNSHKPHWSYLSNPSASNLPGIVSIDWSGPIEPLIGKISAMSGYHTRILGRKPAIPILIDLNVRNTPLAHVLTNIDYQCRDKAKVLIYPSQKIIELRYAK